MFKPKRTFGHARPAPRLSSPLCPLTLAFLVVLTSLPLLSPTLAGAQAVRGRLNDPRAGGPIMGAVVTLLRESGEEVARYLSNESGHFLLRAPSAGTYRLKIERIGYSTTLSNDVTVEEEETADLDLEVSPSPVVLSELGVSAERVCRIRPEDGLGVSIVWEEARKALEVQEWAQEARLYRFRIAQWESTLDSDGNEVSTERWESEGDFDRMPFRTLPVEDLQEEGYVRTENPIGIEYFGPDASVLLSDLFLDTHCLRLAEDEGEPGLLGVAFEPIERRRRTPDIEGVLWVDPASSELRFLDFSWTWNPFRRRPLSGGRFEFEKLPDGGWVVSRWTITMPTRRGYEVDGAEIVRNEAGIG